MKTSIRDSSLFAALTLAIGAANASGQTVCFSFIASITQARLGLEAFGIPEIKVGAEIMGTIEYDPRGPGIQHSEGTSYVLRDLWVTLTVGDVQSLPDETADLPHGSIAVSDAPQGGGTDRFSFLGNTHFTEDAEFILVFVTLEDVTGAALTSEDLPREFDLSRFTSASLEVRSLPGDGRSFLFSADIDAIEPCRPEERPFSRADANADGALDLSDAASMLTYLFLAGPEPSCLKAADANDDGAIDVADAVYTLLWLFVGGQPIPEPHGRRCGHDPTNDALTCAAFGGCE